MFTRLTSAAVALLIVATGLLVSVLPAAASAPTISPSTGYDISYPQCGGSFPASAGFGIVGVNDGHPLSINPCLSAELGWAQNSANHAPAFYLNTDSPGPAYTSNWPSDQQTPQVCSGANSPACSYDYGWNAAQVSFDTAVNAETTDGSSSPTTAVLAARWWLDVETGNHWETEEAKYGATKASDAIDQAMLQGAIAYFTSVGVVSLGIYSTSRQWTTITGGTGSTFATLPAWMPGYPSLSAAEAACADKSFNGGRVAQIQYPSHGLDGDYICGLLSTPSAGTVAVAESSAFTSQMTVTGNVGAVTFVQTTGTPDLTVSSNGLVSTSGALAKGSYIASGTTSDPNGDSGVFTYTLDVGTLNQSSSLSQSATVSAAATYTNQLGATGADGTVTYVQTTGSPSLTVSTTGLVSTDGALTKGSYTATGTMSDATGDSGNFTFTLNVGTITQSLPTSASATTVTAVTFTHQLAVTGNDGTVTFTQTTGTPNLTVSTAGLLATSGTLTPGAYVARGTTLDAFGDKGVFFYDLTVIAAPVIPVTPVFAATRVIGHAVAGKTVTLAITGSGFFGRPTITSHAGTAALVTKDSGNLLLVRVTVKARSRNGTFTFTVTLSNGDKSQVKYVQR